MIEALLSATIISVISVLIAYFITPEKNYLIYMLSLASGVFIGAVFFHILPEVYENPLSPYIIVLSLLLFSVFDKLLSHHDHFKERSVGWLSLLSDLVHNFIDGVAIASAFMVDVHFGILMSIIVLLHELPQELSDYAILLYSGFEKKKALLFNLLVSLSSIIGVVVGYMINVPAELLLSFVAGSMLYIAMSDLIPMLREETKKEDMWKVALLYVAGVLIILLYRMLVAH